MRVPFHPKQYVLLRLNIYQKLTLNKGYPCTYLLPFNQVVRGNPKIILDLILALKLVLTISITIF